MKVYESRALQALALPAVVGAAVISPSGASSKSANAQQPVPVRVAPLVAEYGQLVTVRGTARGYQPGSLVSVVFTANNGARRVIGKPRLNRASAWAVRFKAHSPGRVSASVAIAPAILTPAFGATATSAPVAIKVRTSLKTASSVLSSTLEGTIRPAGRYPVRVEYRNHGRWRYKTTIASNRLGRFRARIYIAHGSTRLRLRVKPANGFAASVPRHVRAVKLRPALASWYGDYGLPVACGGVLGSRQMGVANKSLPCGTRVTISYRGRTVTVPVIDRGPYIAGREYDLTGATARALRFDGVDTVMVSR